MGTLRRSWLDCESWLVEESNDFWGDIVPRVDPDLCRRFVEASIQGWRYAFEHSEEALDIVMANLKKAHIPATRVHQRWMLRRMKDLTIRVDEKVPMGRLRAEDYHRVARTLKEYGMIQRMPTLAEFHREVSGDAQK